MEVKLVIERGRTRTRVVRLAAPETFVGRQRGCGVRIPSAEVSRRHCALRQEDGYLTVEDLGSVNGTFLNGMRVVNREVVRPGDHLEIGPVRFVVEYELTPEALDRLSQFSAPACVEPVDALEKTDGVLEVAEVLDEPAPKDELELVEEVHDFVPVEEGTPQKAPDSDFELGDADQWYVPPADELRGILSQLDDPSPEHKKRR
jgi:pSer/pThr/pTyr-binding forkhead associated (FHA) protein